MGGQKKWEGDPSRGVAAGETMSRSPVEGVPPWSDESQAAWVGLPASPLTILCSWAFCVSVSAFVK